MSNHDDFIDEYIEYRMFEECNRSTTTPLPKLKNS